ncbi:MAG: hypothetical protein ABFC94_03060 [Syntrophomonas sp.]
MDDIFYTTLFITVYFFKRSPELLARRWQSKDDDEGAKRALRIRIQSLDYNVLNQNVVSK